MADNKPTPTALDQLFLAGQAKQNGTVFERRGITRYEGTGVTVTDDAVNGETVISVTGADGDTSPINNTATGPLHNIASAVSGTPTSTIRFSGSAPVVTGIASGTPGRRLVLQATGGPLTLKNDDAGSDAANRILTSSGADATIPDEQTAILVYDGTSQRWRLAGVGLPGSPNRSLQFNGNGSLSGAAEFTYESGQLLCSGGNIAFGPSPAQSGDFRLPRGAADESAWSITQRNPVGAGDLTLLSTFHNGSRATYLFGSDPWSAFDTATTYGEGYLFAGKYLQLGLVDDDTIVTDDYSTVYLEALADPTATGIYTGKKMTAWKVAQHTNFAINGTRQYPSADDFGRGRSVFFFGWANVNPSVNPTSGIVLYVDAADSLLKYRRPDGATVTLGGSAGPVGAMQFAGANGALDHAPAIGRVHTAEIRNVSNTDVGETRTYKVWGSATNETVELLRLDNSNTGGGTEYVITVEVALNGVGEGLSYVTFAQGYRSFIWASQSAVSPYYDERMTLEGDTDMSPHIIVAGSDPTEGIAVTVNTPAGAKVRWHGTIQVTLTRASAPGGGGGG